MNQEKIGKFILEMRKKKNLTQAELAEKLGVSEKSVSNWENARCMPDLSLFKPLCDILDITINDLMSGEKISKEDYQEKFEENIINTINYSNKKETEVNKKKFITLIIFSYLMLIISAFYIKPDFVLGQLYFIASTTSIIVLLNKLIKNSTIIKKIIINIVCILMICLTLTGLDYFKISHNNDEPYFAYYKEISENVEIYKTLFANIYIVNNKTWDRYYIMDYLRKYTKETVPISPFNRNLSGIDNLLKYKNTDIKANIEEVIRSLPLAYWQVKTKIDYQENSPKLIINYTYNAFYEDLYIEKALIYNSVSLFLIFDDIETIELNYNGNKYITTKKIIEKNYPNYNKINEKEINKGNFNIYLENALNYNEFTKEIFNKLFKEN